MKFEEYKEKLDQLKKLVAQGNTGSPKDLAKCLGVSERTARRFVDKLKQKNESIVFCRKLNSYIEK